MAKGDGTKKTVIITVANPAKFNSKGEQSPSARKKYDEGMQSVKNIATHHGVSPFYDHDSNRTHVHFQDVPHEKAEKIKSHAKSLGHRSTHIVE